MTEWTQHELVVQCYAQLISSIAKINARGNETTVTSKSLQLRVTIIVDVKPVIH